MQDVTIPNQHTLEVGKLNDKYIAVEYCPDDSICIWQATGFYASPDTDTYCFDPDWERAACEFESMFSIEFDPSFYTWETMCWLVKLLLRADSWCPSSMYLDTETITDILCGKYEVMF